MRPKIEIDPALGGLESSSIASLLPGLGLEPAVDGEQVFHLLVVLRSPSPSFLEIPKN
jgi:hypothetical protein